MRLPVLLLLLACAGAARAQDVALLAGRLDVRDSGQRSFAAALGYTHPAGDYAALSLGYLNEGHPDGHHRDGFNGQLWLRSRESARGLAFAAAAGPYYYFDTARAPGGAYSNEHGWAPLYSLAATWRFAGRWHGQLQLNRAAPRGKHASSALLLGAGYRFDGVPGNKLHLEQPSADDTLTVLGGQSIVNSFDSERARAAAVEYRRAAAPYLDWSLTWLNEGSTARTRRAGLAAQLWLIRSLDHHVELGMGAGPYRAFDLHQANGRAERLAGLISLTARYHFSRRWIGQLSWNRVLTDYQRDADVLLLGLGASF